MLLSLVIDQSKITKMGLLKNIFDLTLDRRRECYESKHTLYEA